MTPYTINFQNFDKSLESSLEAGDFETALRTIFSHANFAFNKAELKGYFFRMPQLDKALVHIGSLAPFSNQAASLRQPSPPTGQHLIIASEIYAAGGHGRLLNQIAEAFPCHVMFTDIFGHLTAGQLASWRFLSRSVLSSSILVGDGFSQKILRGFNLSNALAPESVILLGHHQDVVAILLGLLFMRGSKTIFIHHADHHPGLGATIKFPVHFDTAPEIGKLCCDFGLNSSIIPLCVDEGGKRVSAPVDGKLIIATSGTEVKFAGTVGGISYADVVFDCLASGCVAKFIHIGDLPRNIYEKLVQKLTESDLSIDLFKPVGRVENVANTLIEHNVNAYLSSFPVPGGLATSEAQSVGLPVIHCADPSVNLPLCHLPSLFASPQLGWRLRNDLKEILSYTLHNWVELSELATAYYFHNNSRQSLNERLKAAFSVIGVKAGTGVN
jgi:hypothetical protein